MQKNVAPGDYDLYCALAEAILDEEKVPAALELLDQRLATTTSSSDGKPKARKKTAKKTASKASKKRARTNKPRRKKVGK